MRVPVPLPYRNRDAAYREHVESASLSAAIRASEEREIPIALLRSTQHTVSDVRLAEIALGINPREHSPVVIERDGRYYVHNGHHRMTLASMRGDRTIRARVARLDGSATCQFRERGRAGDLLMIDPQAMAATYRQREIEDCAELVGGVAVICVDGPLEAKPEGYWWSFFDDYESILCRFKNAMADEQVGAVLLKIDSPGGAAAGLNECVDAMLRCKAKAGKPVYVYADEGAYSAAYALACVGDEIYLPRAGGLGSIGVISGLVDVTEMNAKDGIRYEVVTSGARKADFNPNVPITNAAIARVQKRVDGLAKIYFQLVKATRGVDGQKLEADTFYGKDAVKKGLADGVMSLEAVVDAIQKRLAA